MRTVVIADVHENIDAVKEILRQAKAEHAVFLGDWTDRFRTQPGNLDVTLDWLCEHVKDSDKTFLYGNHDMPYAFPKVEGLLCSGHQWQRREEISAVLGSTRAANKFKLYAEVEGFLLSHAGFHPVNLVGDWRMRCEQALNRLRRGEMSAMVGVGSARGGSLDQGGVTWLDWNDEFKPSPDYKQIVGHTKDAESRWNRDNVCIDTKLHHYAVIDGGVLTVAPTER